MAVAEETMAAVVIEEEEGDEQYQLAFLYEAAMNHFNNTAVSGASIGFNDSFL